MGSRKALNMFEILLEVCFFSRNEGAFEFGVENFRNGRRHLECGTRCGFQCKTAYPAISQMIYFENYAHKLGHIKLYQFVRNSCTVINVVRPSLDAHNYLLRTVLFIVCASLTKFSY